MKTGELEMANSKWQIANEVTLDPSQGNGLSLSTRLFSEPLTLNLEPRTSNLEHRLHGAGLELKVQRSRFEVQGSHTDVLRAS